MVGRGLIGAATAERLRANGHSVITVSRGGPPDAGHLPCDLTSPGGLRALRARLPEVRCAVLTHGPSDVTWIEGHEAEAEAVHVGVAATLAASGVPTVLVSTDNVFPGDRGLHTPRDRIRPINAYGRVKAKAERVLVDAGAGLALRVSLVYGWTGLAHRATYGKRCLLAALRGEPLRAPVDQSFTPIHVDDVSRVVAALCRSAPPVGVAHLAGPNELSRFEFARCAYRLAGSDPGLVEPCRRRDTPLASRPRFSSLACDDFTRVPDLAGWRPLSPDDGLKLMLATAPRVAEAS